MGRLCKFKDLNNEIKEFYPNDIEAFRFIESKYFVSRKVNDKKVFLEYLIKGKVNIYYLRDDDGDHYFLDKEDMQLVELPYEEGVKYENDKQVYFETTKHIGLLNLYMQDAPEFQSRIAAMKKPGHKFLVEIAEDYHNAVCQGEKCIIYKKNQPYFKVNLEGVLGVLDFAKDIQEVYDLSDRGYFQKGILAHLWLPRNNENLYFRTGFLHSTVVTNFGSKNTYKIPIQIEYLFPKGIIRPNVAYGLNMYSYFNLSNAFTGGIKVKLNKSIDFSINYDVDFIPNDVFVFLPRKFFSQSVQIGALFKL